MSQRRDDDLATTATNESVPTSAEEPAWVKPRGICPVCHKSRSLNENGRIRFHLGRRRKGVRQPCRGSQQPPEGADETEAVSPPSSPEKA